MKVLITTDWYAPVINGVVTSVLMLRRELEARGHEVRIVTLSNSMHSYKDGMSTTWVPSARTGFTLARV